MSKLRQMWALTGLGVVALVAASYFLLISPQAKHVAALRADAKTQEDANRVIQHKIDMLKKQKKDLPTQQAELAKFSTKIPSNPELPALVHALTNAADVSGVEIVSIIPGAPTRLSAKAGAVVTTTASAGMDIAVLPINVVVQGEYSQVRSFFGEVESISRAYLVSGVTVVQNSVLKRPLPTGAAATTAAVGGVPVYDGTVTATLAGRVFMTIAPAAPVAPVTSTSTAQ